MDELENDPDLELKQCRVFCENGDFLSLHTAIAICHREQKPVPDWLAIALKQFIVLSLRGELKGKRGRGKSPTGKWQKDLRRFVHFRTVNASFNAMRRLEGYRKIGRILADSEPIYVNPDAPIQPSPHEMQPIDQLPYGYRELIANENHPLTMVHFEKPSLDAACLVASLVLRGSFAQAEPRTIRDSYRSVLKDEEWRPVPPWSLETLEAMGFGFEEPDMDEES